VSVGIYFSSQASPLTRRPCFCDAYRYAHKRCRKCDEFNDPPMHKSREEFADEDNDARWSDAS
jgi:hypothetical protein